MPYCTHIYHSELVLATQRIVLTCYYNPPVFVDSHTPVLYQSNTNVMHTAHQTFFTSQQSHATMCFLCQN